MADISKIKLGENIYNIKDKTAARKGMYVGTCSTAAATAAKVATTDPFPLDGNDLPLVGTVVAIKFSNSNSYKTAGTTMTLNVNNTGDFPIYYNNAEVVSTTSANTAACGYKNRYIFYIFNGTLWVWLSYGNDSNSTYSVLTLANLNTGTETTGRLISAKLLRDNFYTEDEIDTLLGNINLNVQADWEETDNSSGAYILNKPDLLDATYSNGTAYFINSSDPTTAPTNYYTKSEIDTKIGNIETLLASI